MIIAVNIDAAALHEVLAKLDNVDFLEALQDMIPSMTIWLCHK